jgi:hypothetical protein
VQVAHHLRVQRLGTLRRLRAHTVTKRW